MFDPTTLVFRCRLFEIWHKDPCTDGSDDSCGFTYVKLSSKVRGLLEFEAGQESRHPWYQRDCAKEPQSAADAECLLRGLFLEVAGLLRLKLSYDRAGQYATRLLHNSVDNIRSSLVFLPGWHCHSHDPSEGDREEHATGLYRTVARILLTDARPWYRRPRWHVHHWRFSFPWCPQWLRRKQAPTSSAMQDTEW